MDLKWKLSSPSLKLNPQAATDKLKASPLALLHGISSKKFVRQFGKTTIARSTVTTVEEEKGAQARESTACGVPLKQADEKGRPLLLMPPIAPLPNLLFKPSPKKVDVSSSLKRLEVLRRKAESMASSGSLLTTQPSTFDALINRPALTQLLLESVQSPIVNNLQDAMATPQQTGGPDALAGLARLQALRREGNRLVNML